ncbi:hypothetical protein [Megavirus chiliensis]|uniref:Ankyrin repeat protein n=2 Tax=Megamimivirinae TaxID=3044648 RepID=A0A2L2DLF0_MIMIV|nr:hypothetical protein MegaChil _gp0136 [Megavirus chiliensis]AEQ33050.1 hypothetical protein [Megavirus chiliensis]AVG46974.1 hypothetical protein [Acanthamoeba polyphaga mimivirus]
MQKNNVQNKTQLEVTTQSVFGLKYINNDICLHTPSNYKHNDKVTVSMIQFHRRFSDKVGDLFDDFDWSNVLMAGGLVSGLIEAKASMSEYAASDIDLFVYGNKQTVVNKIQEIYNYFIEKLDKKFFAFVYLPDTAILNIIIADKFSIQIIGTLFNNEKEILESFDMTHCQVGFNGNNIIYTNEFIEAITTKITTITKRSIHAYRLVKAQDRGYSIKRPSYCYIKNIFHEYTEKPSDKMPSNTDAYYDINNLEEIIDDLRNNPIVIQNLTKNYIPSIINLDDDDMHERETWKIGDLYAGRGKYKFVNDYDTFVFIDDIREYLKFVRIPFPV